MVNPKNVEQPALFQNTFNELTVVIAGLALGGAERIVLDWATRVYPGWKAHIVLLRDHEKEWAVPPFIKVTRLHGKDVFKQLRTLGMSVAKQGSACLCHLLKEDERNALAEGGAFVVPVLHNASQGWLEDVSCLKDSSCAIAISEACFKDLHRNNWPGHASVIRHIPLPTKFDPGIRRQFRTLWRIPQESLVIGMIGAFKLQKNYPFALRVFRALLKKQDAYLVIVGGPISRKRRIVWDEMVQEIYRLDIRQRVAMPGFLENAGRYLPVFDVLLNTSHFEGFSMATAEALISGMPVVVSNVGGQGELACDGLTLIPNDSPVEVWVDALRKALAAKPTTPSWSKFPTYRLWTLAHLARPIRPIKKVLFVTANLNSGGAQRSLVNLARSIKRKVKFEIAVAGNSTADYFLNELQCSGVKVFRTSDSRDAFDHTEALVQKICSGNIGTVCFWNLDPKIKLLLTKTLGFTKIRFIDVSPGEYSFNEMAETAEFQRLICFDNKEYYKRLNKFVLKHKGAYPGECEDGAVVIANGIPEPANAKSDYAIYGNPRIVVSGRIAPSKFILEILDAMRVAWNIIPNAELHFFGASEPRHKEYAEAVLESSQGNIDKRIFFHGSDFEVINSLHKFDVAVVLGKNQGCPNALLEAMSVGLPAVANDDGGTGEQLIHEKTGLLIKNCDPKELSEAFLRILTDRGLAKELGQAARKHVLANFSMERMVEKYISLFREMAPVASTRWERVCQKLSSLVPKQNKIEKEELQWH